MKLLEVLEHTNTIEKSSFYKVLNNLIELGGTDEIEEILNNNSRQVKEIDNENITKVFKLLSPQFKRLISTELCGNLTQLDIFIDILIRDGNGILKDRWFDDIYKTELKNLKLASDNFIKLIEEENKELEESRRRDYNIYRSCVKTAYINDELNNQDKKVTPDEYSLLQTLAEELELSNEEIRLINFSIVPLDPIDVESIIKQLKDLAIVFNHKKDYNIYVPDEVVKILRELRGKSIADKLLRRILKTLSGPQLNAICKRHNINQRSGVEEKIKEVISQGITLKSLLLQGIHKEGLNVSDKKKDLNVLMEGLGIPAKGTTIEDKLQLIIDHFNIIEKDETLGISMDGYNALCDDLNSVLPEINLFLKNEFQFQEERVLIGEFLSNLNIKPRDVLDLLSKEDIKTFCEVKKISYRGDEIQNILDSYTDTESVLIENFVNFGKRDLNALKANNINVSTAEIGIKYEEVTKLLLKELGFNVNEQLRAEVNTTKDKIDILLQISKDEVIIVECKTDKSTKYNKFSACSRQIKSYQKHLERIGYRVVKTLLVAPDFTPDFIEECDLDIDLNLSLITSETLFNIWNGFKHAPQQVFPINLLMRDALISDQKILKALKVK